MLKDGQFEAFYSTRQQATSGDLWHQRLGHPHTDILQLLVKNKSIVINKTSSSLLCDACQLGKSCRLPFLSSETVSTKPLERVHCDLWGPSPVVSTQGFKYYVIFVDNFSRFTWFYPLKLKSDFFSVFTQFQSLVETQFQTKIIQFQCDGGGEFVGQVFLSHLAACGIKQLVSCPHTPQQNGLAERKHRHITELGFTMMYGSRVPQQLWVEAFFTANFLGNLLPSSSLPDNVSPYHKLFGKQPVYTALRVFGCKCFPYLRPYMKNKMDPKSLVCVFLGYNEKYKGYRCFHPPTGRVYISRHVLFNETEFPYCDIYSKFLSAPTSPLLSAWRMSAVTSEETTEQEELSLREEEFPPLQRVNTTGVPPQVHTPLSPVQVDHHVASSSSSSDTDESDTEAPEVVEPVVLAPHSMTTRAKSGIHKPNPKYALFTDKSEHAEPRSLKASLKHPGWNNAMRVEIDNMVITETFELVPPTVGQKPLNSG